MSDTALVHVTESYGLVPANMSEAMQLATMMASSKLVPVALQKSPADCLMVIQQAIRWQMDPFAVAQECSVIQGKLMHSGKLVAAVVNARGHLAERLRFSYQGDGDKREITVTGRVDGEKDTRTVTVKLKDARTNNAMWTKQPDQQLMYHGSRVWARRHTPELMLGVYSPEEFEEGPRVLKKDTRADYHAMLSEIDDAADLQEWALANRDRIGALPPDWRTNIETVITAKAQDRTLSSGEILAEQWSDKQAGSLRTATQSHVEEPPTELWTDEGDPTPPEWQGDKWEQLGPVAQAGTLCKTKAFWTFLGEGCTDEKKAAECVRASCKIESRRELATNAAAARRWRALVEDYRAWQREPAVTDQVAPRQPDDRAEVQRSPADSSTHPAGERAVPTAAEYTATWGAIIDGGTPKRRAQMAKAWNDDNDLRGQIEWTDAHPFSKLKKRVADALELLKEGAA